MRSQNILIGIIILLAIVIGVLIYDRHADQETLGEKVGNTIDRATGERK